MVADGKVYLGDEDGDVVVMQHGREKKLLAENHGQLGLLDGRSPPTASMFVMTRNKLYAIQEGAQLKQMSR